MTLTYWVFEEESLDKVLREWARDHRHDDPGEMAAKERFETVAHFLFSRQAREKGLLKQQTGDFQWIKDRLQS